MPKEKSNKWRWTAVEDLQNLAEELGPLRSIPASGLSWQPRVDLMELDDKLVIRAELAGVRLENVGLMYNIDRHTILLRGFRDDELADERGLFHQIEAPFGEFQRVIQLPASAIDPEGIRAQYRNGFLYVVIPKRSRIFVANVTITEI